MAGIVDVAEGLDDVGNLPVDLGIKNTVAAANDGFVILEGIPGKRNARCKIVFVGSQRPILRVDLITKAEVQSEVLRDFPGVLPEQRRKRTGIVVIGIAETLFVELRDSQRN